LRRLALDFAALGAVALAAADASAVSLGFSCIAEFEAGACAAGEAHYSVDVSDVGAGQVRFLFSNLELNNRISGIYFKESNGGALLAISHFIDQYGTVSSYPFQGPSFRFIYDPSQAPPLPGGDLNRLRHDDRLLCTSTDAARSKFDHA